MAMMLGGRMRRTHSNAAYRPMAEINVTPFVDVMLVLLVVFMVTAPLLTVGVPVDLPDSDASVISEKDNTPVEISIDGKGKVYLGETAIKPDKLIPLLKEVMRKNPDRRIYIRADKGLSYGTVMIVMGAINRAGFTKVALVSDPGGPSEK